MKIIDERNNEYTDPADFSTNDIVLDADGDWYKILFDDIRDEDYCLEDLEDGGGHIIDASNNIEELLRDNTQLPLIRISSEKTELHIKGNE